MKTAEEIKKGLECCKSLASCNECPYQVFVEGSFGCEEQGCDDGLLPDALAYIRQLEAMVKEFERIRDGMTATNRLTGAYVRAVMVRRE